MKEFRLIFETGNAAFDGPEELLVYRIGRTVHEAFKTVKSSTLEQLKEGLTVRDVNGNAIGRIQYIER